MAEFGGMGGVMGRTLKFCETYGDDRFAQALNRALGAQMRLDNALCKEVWSALANVDWTHENGDTASYSFRAAGDLIASIIGKGDYMDWYCSGPYAQVSEKISDAMKAEGWAWKEMG